MECCYGVGRPGSACTVRPVATARGTDVVSSSMNSSSFGRGGTIVRIGKNLLAEVVPSRRLNKTKAKLYHYLAR